MGAAASMLIIMQVCHCNYKFKYLNKDLYSQALNLDTSEEDIQLETKDLDQSADSSFYCDIQSERASSKSRDMVSDGLTNKNIIRHNKIKMTNPTP